MSQPPDLLISDDDDDTSQVSTPILSHLPTSSICSSPFPPESSPTESVKPSSVLPGNSSHLRLPIPTPSANLSQTSFSFVDVSEDEGGVGFDDLPPEIASVDISIAPDGSFVETSSGQAAHELKKRYDRLIKVDKDHRSPYAITAFVNQHGKQMYRVGHRDQSAPAADAEHRTTMQLEQPPSSPDTRQDQTRRKSQGYTIRSERNASRKGRMSMHAFLPGTMFPSTSARSGDLRKARSNPQISADPLPPPPPPARGHSQSVTAADLPRLPIYSPPDDPVPASQAASLIRDGFADVMRWDADSGPSSPISSRSHSHGSEFAPSTGSFNPFGSGVHFESPAPARPTEGYLHVPLLREMQSFESGMTARADAPLRIAYPSGLAPISSLTTSESPVAEGAPSLPPGLGSSDEQGDRPLSLVPEEQDEEPTSVSPTRSPSPLLSSPRPNLSDPTFIPTDATSMHTRYSTEVFDVLQTYRGLPVLERLLEDPADSAVIKMTLIAEDSAAPRDDPRFVIWGTVARESYVDDSQTSRRSSGEFVHLRVTTDGPERERVLVAATIERWLAQLTSALDYDELLVFFLTYRSYITTLDLCHLLICRFHWALGRGVGGEDEMVRRVVRVRTFVAIRYWLLTFFAVDFVPNRELRLLLASWLNTLRRDPILQKHTDATSIVRKLMSVARDAKEAYSQRPRASMSKPSSGVGTPNGVTRRSSSINDEDLDLDFIAEPSALLGTSGFIKAKGVIGADGAAMIQQPLHRAILEHRPSLSASVSPTASLPSHPPNALSRALANTMGRLGRWKRALNPGSRNMGNLGLMEVSAFDLESNGEGDLIQVRGGMEQYLKMIQVETHRPSSSSIPPAPPTLPPLRLPPPLPVDPLPSLDPPHPIPPTPPPAFTPDNVADSLKPAPITSYAPPSRDSITVDEEEVVEVAQEVVAPNTVTIVKVPFLRAETSSRSSTSSTSSSSSYGMLVPPQSTFHARRSMQGRSVQDRSLQQDVVSIDDLDFSDTSSETSEGPVAQSGLRKLPRRLPLRRDFEFVDRNRESVSSMGFASQDESSASASNSRRSSAMSGALEGKLGNTIHQWQVNALIDSLSDDEDEGDVEDALRRLEGQMNPQKQRAKETKVDNWVKTIRDRLAAGDYGDEAPRYLSDDGENEPSEAEIGEDAGTQGSAPLSTVSSPSRPGSPASVRHVSSFGVIFDSSTSVPGPIPQPAAAPPIASRSAEDKKPVIEDAVPAEIRRGRLAAPGTTPAVVAKIPSTPARLPMIPPTGTGDHHRSWVLSVPTVALSIHFSMIDRELFLAIKFEELVSDDWRGSEAAKAANVLDWGQFLKDRARYKAQGVEGYRTSALVAARARFNLLTNFVISEIVDTQPTDRPALAAKFIRVAWKCFQLNNFSALVAIVAGLRSDWVSRAMKRGWERVNLYNLRILKDLTSFADPADDFKHIRRAVAQLTDPKLTAGASEEAVSVRSSARGKLADGKAAMGVPFLGIYLAPLQRVSRLPDLIDPTAPTELVSIEPVSGNFSAPAHPEVFNVLPSLPSSMHLEPLINVHKQRLVARTVKALVAGQHLASRLQYPIDRRLFQRCLRLRGLDYATLNRKLAMYPD
ncbi:hypothetical protein B0F90DRAFT_1732791 [Multifurca ochricompacta]|uniref:Ras GEF n=1 Tax=Multifurca ochricompacta TaxID=376703 RepID=A0AAD4M325_9AGAM|nr:hypothetical protein B0F90DRAFT_1732791 [Multifurca ochricompacta]